MSRSNAIVLLLSSCFLLSTIMIGPVHADECTPSYDTHFCMVTNKTTYARGETVTITVEADSTYSSTTWPVLPGSMAG
jgi:hypothetical protein